VVRAEPDGPGGPRPELVRLVTRLVVAQTVAAAVIGLPFSRRHLPSIIITLALVVALTVLALLVRSGTRTAWLVAAGFELAYIGYGLSRFFYARYLGGTLLAILTAGALAHPAVAGAFSVRLSRRPAGQQAEPGLGGQIAR
jgi:ribose/xylose/arabinose/galactoside ABC-type transport system permease subunit